MERPTRTNKLVANAKIAKIIKPTVRYQHHHVYTHAQAAIKHQQKTTTTEILHRGDEG
jgi:hypothetical protein